MSQQGQALKFGAVVLQNLPELSGDVMQGWIQNSRSLQRVLKNALCPPESDSSLENHQARVRPRK